MSPWKRVCIVGVPGVGKTSLSRTLSGKLGYHHFNYGEVMLEIALKRDLALSLSQMLQLDLDVQYKIWKKAAFYIKTQEKRIHKDEGIILDLHGLDHFKKGYLISLPFEIISPDIIIIIESSYEDIIKRRLNDSSKERFLDPVESLEEYMKILRLAMVSVSASLGCNLAMVYNDDFKSCLNKLEFILNE